MLYDQFNGSQANNGVGPPNPQATSGAPGFNVGSWGNLPPNLAGGLQAFMAARGAPNAGMMPARPPIGGPGMFGAPNAAMPPGGAGGVMAPPGTLSPGVAGGTVPGPGTVSSPAMQSGGAVAAQNGAMPTNTGVPYGASTPMQNSNFAGGLRPFLGR